MKISTKCKQVSGYWTAVAFLCGVLTEIQWVIRTTTLCTLSHYFLHKLQQTLQANSGAHLSYCSMAPKAPSSRVKRSGFETDQSTLSSVKVVNEYSRYTSSMVLYLQYAIRFNSMHRDNFSFISRLNYKDGNIHKIIMSVSVKLLLAQYGKRLCCVKTGWALISSRE